MATVASDRRGMRFSWRGLATALAVAGFLYLVVRFLSFSVPGVGKHGDKAWAYWLHIGGGTLVMLIAPFQFIAPIRNRFRKYHRWAGYSFVAGSVAAFLGFWAIQPKSPLWATGTPFAGTDAFFLSQATAISLWMVAMAAAVIAARRKRFLTHQHNMTRAFVLAAYFVVVRLMDTYGMDLIALGASNKDAANAHSDWIAWVIPLVLVEVYYGRKWDRLLRRRSGN